MKNVKKLLLLGLGLIMFTGCIYVPSYASETLEENLMDDSVSQNDIAFDVENILKSIDSIDAETLKSLYKKIKNNAKIKDLVFSKIKNDEVLKAKIFKILNEQVFDSIYENINEAVASDEKYEGLAVFKEEILKDSEIDIKTKFMTRNDCFSAGETINVKGIMVHSTASPGIMAEDWYYLWNKSYENKEIGREVCVHAFLDDKSVWQYLPWNHRGWHAGGKANNTHIGFEICEPGGITYSANNGEIILIDVEGTKDYFEKVYNNAVKLCVMLCKQFNLTEKDIVCHCEGYELGIASNHADVMHWWKFYGKDMDMFREDVKKLLNDETIQDEIKQ